MQIITRDLGRTDYASTWLAMQQFTANRNAETPDELWLTEHGSVYTLGLNRKNVRLPQNDIPLVLVDRGGKITYHGPGQIVIYTLLDMTRRKFTVRQLVDVLETSIIKLLAQYDIKSNAKNDAPGVYVNDKKIASLGLRVKNHCCYHGLSLNVAMDLTPFEAIDPCGYAGLQVTQLQDETEMVEPLVVGRSLLSLLAKELES